MNEELHCHAAPLDLATTREPDGAMLEQLSVLAQEVGTAHDLTTIFRALKRFLEVSVPYCGMFVALYDEAAQQRRCVFAASEDGEEDVSSLPVMGMNGSPQSRAIQSFEVIVDHSDDLGEEGGTGILIGAQADPRLPCSAIAVPMVVLGRAVGAFEVQSVIPHAYKPKHVTALRMAANLAAIAVDNVRLLEGERTQRLAAEASETRFRHLVEQAADAIFVYDDGCRITDVNDEACRSLGYTRGELLGRCIDEVRQGFAGEEIQAQLGRGEVATAEGLHRRKDGSLFPVELRVGVLEGAEGRASLALARDISERKRAEALDSDRRRVLELVAGNEALATVFEQLLDLVERQRPSLLCSVTLLHDGRLYDAVFERPRRYQGPEAGFEVGERAGACGAAAARRALVVSRDIAGDPLWQTCREAALHQGVRSCWAMPMLSGAGQVLGVFAVLGQEAGEPSAADLELLTLASQLATIAVEQHRRLEQLAYQAQHDALTGLPNRLLFEDRLDQAIRHAQRYDKQFGVLFIDIDRFKHINDTLGHHIGDALLQEVAVRLKCNLRASDTVARMGGDEFTVIVSEISGAQDAVRNAQKLLDILALPFVLQGRELFMTASIGISLYPDDGYDPVTLQRNADSAMYRAKDQGRNRFYFFSPELTERALERLELENHLRRAVVRGDFELHYQPLVDLASGTVVGLEALLRWPHTELGFISPMRFVPLAEESGLIVPIGTWVLEEACRQIRAWQRAGHTPVCVNVNVSAAQFARSDFVETVAGLLARYEIAPHLLGLELTESMVMNDVEAVIGRLERLRDLGIHISVDDFGTGYSSLAYLQRLPVDCLKIDKSFIKGIGLSPRSGHDTSVLVQAVVALAHNLGLSVLAEGVETPYQLDFLRGVACDKAQGYHFAKPLPARDVWRATPNGQALQVH